MNTYSQSSSMFVSWTRENGRTQDLAKALQIPAHFIFTPSKFGLLGRYVKQLRATRAVINKASPHGLLLMLPPAPALLSLVGTLRRNARLLVDLHTGFFEDPKWKWALRPSLWFVRKMGGIAIVTNEPLATVCRKAGVDAVVLHDVLQEGSPLPSAGHVLCPLSYANDEPVDELIEAARLTPELRWILTGRAPLAVKNQAPHNVVFPGFVTNEEYHRLLATAGVVVAVTTRPYTMQRAGYEAFNQGVPHVTSHFPELTSFYESSAAYVSPHAKDIADACRHVLQHRERFTQHLQRLRRQRISEQQSTLERVNAYVAGMGTREELLNVGSSA